MNKSVFYPEEFGAHGDGVCDDTKAIQECINRAGKKEGIVVLQNTTYLTGALFLKSNMEFRFSEESVLLGIKDESAYPEIMTRVAGIEMHWPAGVLNIIGEQNVIISGNGTINGNGSYWWNKFWGIDQKSGMMKEYEDKGVRWAADYDCKRPRNVLVWKAENVKISDIRSIQSAFWNIHVCYCKTIELINIIVEQNTGPSTDGIDIDSSEDVVIRHCDISCNDDCICIKAGRDADGMRVNRKCINVLIDSCILREGEGMTLGSETSGGIENVRIKNLKFYETRYGIRMKSSRTRGGYIKKIEVSGLELTDVGTVFAWQMDWYPLYSYCQIPENYKEEIPEYWLKLCKKIPENQGLTVVSDVVITDVKTKQSETSGIYGKIFDISGYSELPIKNIFISDVEIYADQLGMIQNVQNMQMKNINVHISERKKT